MAEIMTNAVSFIAPGSTWFETVGQGNTLLARRVIQTTPVYMREEILLN